ncbi:MAG: hypothetical protein E7635_01195 [Ruminococcaceae bacterium]|nr:hypothetical protein [Oscillospiraceae bacterium]
MFGYVEPQKPELRLWEYEEYRGVYCGLCKTMGKKTGLLSRLSLNYDYVFLAMIRSALLGISPKIEPGFCLVHPTKKRAIVKSDAALEYCAEVSALLTYHKVIDNINDSRGAKKLASMLIKPVCSSFVKRCIDISAAGGKIAEYLCDMAELEKEESPTPDMLAECFGEIMREIFAYRLNDEKSVRIAEELGRHVGRYIYLADALDDIDYDIKYRQFNPFVSFYGKNDVLSHLGDIKTAVLLGLKGLEAAIALVDFSTCTGYGNIVNNIIYLGMPGKIDSIIKKLEQTDER